MLRRIGIAVLLPVLFTVILAAAVPNPVVTGPIPVTAEPGDPSHNYPFFSANDDLAAYGYVEEEFFFEGTANRYSFPTIFEAGSIIDGGHRYRTRMVVRRPNSASNFNGVVLMEWQNSDVGYDLDGLWAASHHHYMRRGYAWIGVSAQSAGIHSARTGLKAWSPNRYATLDVTEGGAITDDALCYDIFSQASQAVRSFRGIDPMGGLPVKRVVAMGMMSAATPLITYHNSIHPLSGMFDAYFLAGGGARLRPDLDVKAIKVLSERAIGGVQASLRQPDTDHFRWWEVAGAADLDFQMGSEIEPLRMREGIGGPRPACDLPSGSRIPYNFVENAALDNLVRWVERNIEPPSAQELALVTISPTVVFSRDRFGNAYGGIRLSQHSVPTATNTGVNSGPGSCRLFGSYQPFDDASLAKLYPDHMTYVIQVIEATLDNLKAGFIVPEDAAATISDAVQSDIGKP